MHYLVLLVGVLLLLGCQGAPTAAPEVKPVSPAAALLRAEGDALAARGEYGAAVGKFQAAVEQDPENVSLHYALGTALSHLDRRRETVEQFQWVVAHGKRDSAEVNVARSWLVNAGELISTTTMASATPAASVLTSTDYRGPRSTVRGKTEWTGVAGPTPYWLDVVLAGSDAGSGRRWGKRIRLGEPYVFENVPPGAYRLTAESLGMPLWDLRVTTEANKDAVVDLSPSNSPVSPAKFPGAVLETFRRHAAEQEHHPSSRDATPPTGKGHDHGSTASSK